MTCLENKVLLLWTAQNGYVVRNDGLLDYLRTGFNLTSATYDLDGSDVEAQQPRLVGGIAPNSKPAAANLNGEGRYFTHPEISFGAGDAWSLTFVINNYGQSLNGYICGIGAAGGKNIAITSDSKLLFRSATDFSYASNVLPTISKNNVVTLTANGDGNLLIYSNGTHFQTINIPSGGTEITLVKVFDGRSSNYFFGSLSAYHIQSSALTATEVADLHTTLRSLYPEIESVDIGTQTWATRNFEAVATPLGNVIANVTENGAVEKVTGGDFESGLIGTLLSGDETGTWTLNTTDPILGTQDGLLQVTTAGTNSVRPAIVIGTARTAGKWRKLSFKYKVNSGTCILQGYNNGGSVITKNTTISGTGTFTEYYKVLGTNSLVLYFSGTSLFNVQLDDISEQELNWSNATEIYDAVYAATVGTTAEKEYAALKEAAAWAYHTNSVDLGAIYGKIYNGYGKDLLVDDIALQADWGYHVATEAELTTLATNGGYALKYAGTDYWTTTGGTNTTGFTALGGGTRSDVDGSFSTIKDTTAFWCADSDKVLLLNHADNTATITAVDKAYGAYVRLVKD